MSGKPLIKGRVDGIGLADIKGHEFGFAAGFLNQTLGFLRRSMVGFVVQKDSASVFRQFDGNCSSYPPACAGY